MSYRVNPELTKEIAAFGGKTVEKCFNCGSCTAVCALSKGDTVFPRKMIRYFQIGLDDRVLESPEPWLCYYCGTCSDTCPREAHPGELMMATRRWLTSRYDWTGISKRLYTSQRFELGLLLAISLVVLALFVVPGIFGVPFGFAAARGEALQHVRLDLFARREWIHVGDWVLAGILTLLLSLNAFRMVFFVRRGEPGLSIPLSVWIGQIPKLVTHAFTQKRWLECDPPERRRWLLHLWLFSGYIAMAMMVEVFLPWFQRDTAEFHFTALIGYYSTAALLTVTLFAMLGRIRKTEQIHKHSHRSDWTFLILLFLTALSGIVLHLCRMLDLAWPTYVLYVGHLMIAVPLLVTQVPFGKWPHLAFRPLAIYLAAVHETARERQNVGRLQAAAARA